MHSYGVKHTHCTEKETFSHHMHTRFKWERTQFLSEYNKKICFLDNQMNSDDLE